MGGGHVQPSTRMPGLSQAPCYADQNTTTHDPDSKLVVWGGMTTQKKDGSLVRRPPAFGAPSIGAPAPPLALLPVTAVTAGPHRVHSQADLPHRGSQHVLSKHATTADKGIRTRSWTLARETDIDG